MIADNAAQRQVSTPQTNGEHEANAHPSPITSPTFLNIYDFLGELNELYTTDAILVLDVLTMARDAHVNMDVLINWLAQQIDRKQAAQ
jgi:hypothetical protein